MAEEVHVVVSIANGVWARPIRRHGVRELANWKDEHAIAKALRTIADEFDKGMTFQVFTDAERLLTEED